MPSALCTYNCFPRIKAAEIPGPYEELNYTIATAYRPTNTCGLEKGARRTKERGALEYGSHSAPPESVVSIAYLSRHVFDRRIIRRLLE
jgi:hypothetical protein